MLEIKSRHLTWGGPNSVKKCFIMKEISLASTNKKKYEKLAFIHVVVFRWGRSQKVCRIEAKLPHSTALKIPK